MKKRRILSFFLILILFSSSALPATAAFEPVDAVSIAAFDADAKAALLIEEDTGEILYEKNARERSYPASLTKIMTALLVLEAVDAGRVRLDQEVTPTENAFEGLAADGSTASIKAGETLTVEQLLNCMLIVSANEACNILAEAVSGTVESFVAQMNQRAALLGCEDTHYVNPSGLHSDRHYTTAWDIYLITQEAMKYDAFIEICARKSYEVPETNLSKARTLHSTNYLISTWRTGWPGYYYEDARGIKTGSTPEAGYCLVSSAVRGSRRLVSVVLGAERVTLDDGTIQTRSFSETIRLFEYGFDSFASRQILGADEFICEVPVALSSETNYVVVHPETGLTRMMPVELGDGDLERTVTLYAESVDAPVAAGDELGTITLSYGDTVYGTVPLLALTDVSASWVLTAQRDALEFLSQKWVKLAAAGVAALTAALVVLRAMSIPRRRRRSKRRGSGGGSYSYNGYRGRRRR